MLFENLHIFIKLQKIELVNKVDVGNNSIELRLKRENIYIYEISTEAQKIQLETLTIKRKLIGVEEPDITGKK